MLFLFAMFFSAAISKADPGMDTLTILKIDAKLALLTSPIPADPTICYAFDDATNHFTTVNQTTGVQTNIGVSNVSNIEAITISLDGNTVYGANGGTWGSFNLSNGTFTSIGNFGSGFGNQGNLTMSDVDGLSVDPTNGDYYGTHRSGDGGAPADVLFRFNPVNGAIIQDAFGSNEYVSVGPVSYLGTIYYDIDDIAIDPLTGIMYGVANSGTTVNLLVTINKTSGATTTIGRFQNAGGTYLPDVEGLSFNNAGTLFLSTGTNPSQLYTVNKSNAISSLVGQLTIGSDYEGIACLTAGIVSLAAVDDSATTQEGMAVTIDVTGNDLGSDLDPTTVSTTGLLAPLHGTTSINPTTGEITYMPYPGYIGTDVFEYKVCDLGGSPCDIATVSVSIICEGTPNQNDIYGTVFQDEDQGADFDYGESGVAGVTVNLYIDNAPLGGSVGPEDVLVSPNGTTITDANGEYQFSLQNNYEITGTPFSVQTAHEDDDAREKSNGTVETDKDLKITKSGDDTWNGLRFPGINLPSGAVITNAYIRFTSKSNKSGTEASVRFYGQTGSDNPTRFVDNSNGTLTGRPRTTATIDWLNMEAWSSDNTYDSPDLSPVLNEILNVQGEISNGSFVIITQSIGPDYQERNAFDYGASSADAPELFIEYTIPGDGPFHYLVQTNTGTYPANSTLTTPLSPYNVHNVEFTQNGTASCNNDFGLYINYPPVPKNDAFTVCEDGTILGNLFVDNGYGFDSDPNGDAFVVSQVNGSSSNVDIQFILPSGAMLKVTQTGTINYDPNGQFPNGGTDQFSYIIKDGNLSSQPATVTLTVVNAADAGTDGILTLCQGESVTETALFNALGGNPQAGGNWSSGLGPPGVYTYTVAGTYPCPDASANVEVVIQTPPDPGTNGSISICNGTTVTEQELFAALGGSPEMGGVWSPTPIAGGGTYTYTLSGGPACPDVHSEVTVVEESCSFAVSKSGNTLDGLADRKGDVIQYTIIVSNTGNLQLTSITVNDPLLSDLALTSGDTDMDNILDVGESWVYSGSYILTQTDIQTNGGGDGDIDNTVSVTTLEVPGPVTASYKEPLICTPEKAYINIAKN